MANRLKEASIILEVKNLSKFYDKNVILENVSFSAKDGEIVGIIGKNGSGKSTLLSILSGFNKKYSGEVLYDNKSINDLDMSFVGYVPQEDFLLDDLSVRDNINFWASAYKLKTDYSNVFDELGLTCLNEKKVKNLSGGMKRRLMIALSVMNEPSYILLDEPNTGLDYYYKNSLYEYLTKQKSKGKTIIYVGHDIYDLAQICDKLFVLENAKLREDVEDETYNDIKTRIESKNRRLR